MECMFTVFAPLQNSSLAQTAVMDIMDIVDMSYHIRPIICSHNLLFCLALTTKENSLRVKNKQKNIECLPTACRHVVSDKTAFVLKFKKKCKEIVIIN